ncbi:MAG: mechanosensitive ion channel domain-containing protein [Pseudomonadota bacterium]|uniref:mechanosensitive ion channel family protein n=1 Tax=unclassified Phenylobacterium TaxID=2640670 RepID=UPI0007015DC8|nr:MULTISPECIES: mechanosensitive ion channel domain-containing protein [unclassified Phenylobacterium]KRB40017.1 transporter [Phenylobacterium sp. Root700]MBT9469662.1 mechanosensitive ion channel [Phenylobacterium sp.]
MGDLIATDFFHFTNYELVRLGKSSITVGGLAAAIVIIAVAILASRLAASALRRVRGRASQAAPSIYIFEKLTTYGLVVFGVIAAFSTLGLDLSSLTLFAGALGVGLGFGMQGIVKEFISGLVLLFDKLIRIGDYIELQTGERGIVAEIGPRATRIRNNDDLDVLIPNSRLIEAPVTNWTHQNGARRMHIPFIVAYGADKEKVREAVLRAAHDIPFTLKDTSARKTQVWLVGFATHGLNFELVVWPALEAVKRPNATHAAYTWAIESALRSGGFEIPLPQQELRVRSVFGEEGDAARRALGLKGHRAETAAQEAQRSINDAAEDLVRGARQDAAAQRAQQPKTPKTK